MAHAFLPRTVVSAFLLIISCLVFSVSSAQAQAEDGGLRLTTSPLPINLSVEPGSSVSTQLRIKNDGAQKETLKIDLMKFKADGESGAPLPLDREPGDDFFDWVHFSEDTFDIDSNQWKTINATFDVPETAAFGYYYAIVFSRAAEASAEAGKSQIAGGTAILVLLEAKVPNAKREVTVTSFSADQKWYEFLPATFTVKLKNTDRTVSRRSEPSSRAALIGEQPNPWELLHPRS